MNWIQSVNSVLPKTIEDTQKELKDAPYMLGKDIPGRFYPSYDNECFDERSSYSNTEEDRARFNYISSLTYHLKSLQNAKNNPKDAKNNPNHKSSWMCTVL
jgi:hypothetical protein